MIESPAKILHIACGTKTGKTMGLLAWLAQGMLNGEACSYVGPWFHRSQRSFAEAKNILAPFIAAKRVRVNEARLQLSTVNGYWDFTSADNPMNAFGGNYSRVVIDEASRCPREIFPAALTTISAAKHGRLRLASNVELGSKNWAVSQFLRVQKMSPEERAKTGEDILTFPTGGDGLVAPEVIQLMRSQMPEALWRALYLGEIPTSDTSLFRNLDDVFTGRELDRPIAGVEYYLAADVARKKDWSVLCVIDNYGRVVAMDRFHEISWSLQTQRAKLLYESFHCRKAIVDATGIGDVVAEKFEEAGMEVQPFIFTLPSRRLLVEELVIACDSREIVVPASEKFRVFRHEMESMEFVADGTSIKYAVPSGTHDDALFCLALAVHVFRDSRGMVLGLLDLLKRKAKEIREGVRDRFGELIHKPEPEPKPVVVVPPPEHVITRVEPRVKANQQCPACKSTSTIVMSSGVGRLVLHCNQCKADDGVFPIASPGENCPTCHKPFTQWAGGQRRCQNCGQPPMPAPVAVGMTRAQYERGRGRRGRF